MTGRPATRSGELALAELREAHPRLAEEHLALQQRLARTQRLQQALLEMTALAFTDLERSTWQLLERDAETLDVERVSYWVLRTRPQALICEAQWIRSSRTKERGVVIPAEECPSYFQAMRDGKVVAVQDAATDPRARELAREYLPEHGVRAFLDVPVYVRGKLLGVICHEHVGGTREWSPEEQQFALSISQQLSLAIEAQARRTAERALRESEARLRAVMDTALDAVVTLDAMGRVEEWNAQAGSLFGWSASEAVGQLFADLLLPKEARDAHHQGRRAFLAGGEWPLLNRRLELRAMRRDGTQVPVEMSMAPVPVNGSYVFSAFLRDITERRRAEEELRHSAFHDSLTRLPNRAFFLDLLRRELSRAQRHATHRFAVLFLDLDGLKAVNDTLGHKAGDELLVAVADRLRSCLRATDAAARLSGDEFTILMSDVERVEEAEALAERIGTAIAAPLTLHGQEVRVTASIGIVLGNGEQKSHELLRDADQAMYRAKSAGKGRWAVFEPTARRQSHTREELASALRHAVERNELGVRYQPIFSLADGSVAGLEALMRWEWHPGEEVPPAEFLPLAEETREIHRMGRWLLDEAFAQLSAWRTGTGAALRVHVNLSPIQLAHDRLAEDLTRALQRSHLGPEALQLDVSESALAQRTDAVAPLLARLPGTKCVDDFGTGNASLRRLHQWPVTSLKIDRSCVARLHDAPELVRAMVALAHGLGLTVVAEGVETADQLRAVKALGCDFAQGFFLAPPLTAEQVPAVLARPPTV